MTSSTNRRRALLVLAICALLVAGCAANASVDDPGDDLAGAAGALSQAAAATPPAGSDPLLLGQLGRAFAGASVRGLLEADLRAGPPAPMLAAIAPEVLASVRARIDEIVTGEAIASSVVGALVYELETGEVVYERGADQLLKPASNTKLFTTAAAFELLGPDHRFETKVFADGSFDAATGTLHGDLVILGQHDLTWSDELYPSKDFVLDQLAAEVRAEGIERIDGHVVATGEFVYDGHRYGTYDADVHRRAAVKAFRSALQRAGVSAGGRATRDDFAVPDGARLVASWRSLPLSVAAVPINRVSHNELADALVRHLGYVQRGESSYAAGTAEVVAWLESVGIDTTGVALHDGSGLSHDNRVSARHLTALVEHMLSVPSGRVWRRTLSVAGEYGTFAGRMRGPDTRGRVFVKSGTLDGVITTAGFFVNAHDGRTYVLALLMNETAGRAAPRTAQNAIVEAFAGDLRAQQGRPAVPELRELRSQGDGHSATLRWDPVAGADGYWIWTSEDGARWERRQYTGAQGSATLRDWPLDARLFARVSAVAASGAESDLSDVFVARVGELRSRVLVVDGNDRWQAEPAEENTLGGAHDFLVDYAGALGGVGFDSASDDAVAAGEVSLADYTAVLWAAGEQGSSAGGEAALDADERSAIERYLTGGGNLLLSGSEVASELNGAAASDDAAHVFCSERLRAGCAADDAHTTLVRGAGGIFAGLPVMGFLTPGAMEIDTADVLEPLAGAEPCLAYVGGRRGAAAVQVAGQGFRLVHLGFPFESIDNGADRAALMAAVLEFFEL